MRLALLSARARERSLMIPSTDPDRMRRMSRQDQPDGEIVKLGSEFALLF